MGWVGLNQSVEGLTSKTRFPVIVPQDCSASPCLGASLPAPRASALSAHSPVGQVLTADLFVSMCVSKHTHVH